MWKNHYSVYFYSLLLAFCSLFYELVYAQILSVCLGGTKAQYLLTISLFTFALGIGSLIQKKFQESFGLLKSFFSIELLLIVLGSAGPFLIAWMLQSDSFGWTTILLSYSVIFFIGLLSGFEIPSLFSLAPQKEGKVLAFDYLGMLLASVLFPLAFLPQLGTAASTLFVANLNVVALIWLSSSRKAVKLISYAVNFSLFFLILNYKQELNSFLSLIYLEGR